MTAIELERFETKVDKRPFGCWLWTRAKNADGYGYVRVGGRWLRAHRVAYEHWVGPIPEGLILDHLCRVPACVRPDHLEPVTYRENSLRGQSGAESADRDFCPRGHPYSGENLYVHRKANGGSTRYCRECQRASARRYYASKMHAAESSP